MARGRRTSSPLPAIGAGCGIHARSHALVRAALCEWAGAGLSSCGCASAPGRMDDPLCKASHMRASNAAGSSTSKCPRPNRMWGRMAGHLLHTFCTAPTSSRWRARVSWRARCAVACGVRGPARSTAFRAAAAAPRIACLVRRQRSGGEMSRASRASTLLRAMLAKIGWRTTHGTMGRCAGATSRRLVMAVTIGVWSDLVAAGVPRTMGGAMS